MSGANRWSRSALADTAQWSFLDAGLEETVPLALVSPPIGAHLVSGVGDVDGFRHDDFSQSPAEGSFAGPRMSNTEDLAYAGQKPEILVRVGTSREGILPAAISRDGGLTWTALGSEPAQRSAAGTVTISADGGTIVWTPRRGRAFYTLNSGTNWAACAGLPSGSHVIADRVNPDRFYAYELGADRCWAGTDGAVRFQPASRAPVAGTPATARDSWRDGSTLYAAPNREGDLWLALRDRGLFHSSDGGVHFSRAAKVERAISLGFGKPASGMDYPALFLAGRIQSTTGLFRSDNGGKSWNRINDDAHQFGWIDHVTGDPRIFGRVYIATGGRGIIWGEPAM